MDWDKLRVFHAVAEAGSFTHAGEVLNLSQSAIHLATALWIDDEVEFVTYDERLATAAREHRLRVVQPGRT